MGWIEKNMEVFGFTIFISKVNYIWKQWSTQKEEEEEEEEEEDAKDVIWYCTSVRWRSVFKKTTSEM